MASLSGDGSVINLSKIQIGIEEKIMVKRVLDSGMLAQGRRVKEFEEKFAKLCGTKYAIAVNSGTAAIHCALYAIGIKKDDEVITIPFTFVATANPILMQGGKIVFVDVDEKTFNIDPKQIESKITNRTKAIIAVNLYGQPANYKALRTIANKYNLKIVEDACQSHMAEYDDKMSGNLGNIGCFSFYATKNLCCGEGGMITTNNAEWAEQCKRFRHHGQSEKTKYEYHDLGYNYRMTDLTASIGLIQLERLPLLTNRRIINAGTLTEGLKDVKGVTPPYQMIGTKHVFHQYTLKCKDRDKVQESLKEHDIQSGIYYPKPLHLHPFFKGKDGDFPVSERLAKEVLSIPVHPSLTDKDLKLIIEAVKK